MVCDYNFAIVFKQILVSVIIVLSLLNNVQAQNNYHNSEKSSIDEFPHDKIITSTTFDIDGFYAEVFLVKDVTNPQINKIWLDFEIDSHHGVSGFVTELNHVEYHILGEDNKLYSNISFDNIFVEDFEHRFGWSSSFSNNIIVDHIKQLVSSETVNISAKHIDLNLVPSIDGWLVPKENVDTSWLTDAKEHAQAWGNHLGNWEINTSDGLFRVFIYDTDGDKNNFEEVAIEKENGPTLQVRGIIGCEARFTTIDNEIKQVDLPQIIVHKRGIGKHSIYNVQLWEFLVALYQNEKNNNAIDGFNASFTYDIRESARPLVVH